MGFGTFFLILLTFTESLKVFLIDMIAILMMSAKLATPDLLEITVFLNKFYDVIISASHVPNKILSGNSNYIVVVTLAFPREMLQ